MIVGSAALAQAPAEPLVLKPATAIETAAREFGVTLEPPPEPAASAVQAPAAEPGVSLKADPRLSRTGALSTVWSDAMTGAAGTAASKPWFNQLRPLLDVPR